MMSREDLLRELELLPVWEVRNPAPETEGVHADQARKSEVSVQAVESVSTVAHSIESLTESSTWSLRLMTSQSREWLFILGQEQDAEAEQLLKNMLNAVNVKGDHNETVNSEAQIEQHQPKIIVVMGEVEAQQLLNEKQSIEQMRGKPHFIGKVPVIVTYSPNHLLLNLADKAKAWEDLCLAKFTIANL
jgi:DNA polymerase